MASSPTAISRSTGPMGSRCSRSRAEIPKNRRQNVTNAAALATDVFRMFEGPKEGIRFIERYPKDGEQWYAQERFAEVLFKASEHGFCNPEWRHVKKEEVMAIVEDGFYFKRGLAGMLLYRSKAIKGRGVR